MSISVDLGNDDERLIRVTVADAHLSFVSRFAKDCYRTGVFRTRKGARNTWQMDCRYGLGSGASTQALAAEISRAANANGISQFVGTGFGAYLLVGAILGIKGSGVQGALVRPERKRHGCGQIIEGTICSDRPVCVVDDILNSGETACRLVRILRKEGFENISYACIFNFCWGAGVARLAEQGVDCTWLAEVTRRNCPRSPSRTTGRLLFNFWRSWFA